MSYCRVTVESGLYELELNRPDAMNALSQPFLDELISHLQVIENDAKARVLIICSASEKAFCAGADLKERKTMNEDQVRTAVAKIRSTMNMLAGIQVPTIAAVRGVALGGGFELALSCDLRVAAESATFGLTETRLAILPGAGGTQRLSRLVGPSRAKDLIFTGRRISGQEALDLRIVEYVVFQEEVHEKARSLANLIAEGGPIALKQAKWAIDQGYGRTLEQGLQIEQKAYEQVIHTEDRMEGLRAFAEKRKPIYKGR